MAELILPNPGNGRYWDIGADTFGDFTMTLRDSKGKRLSEGTVYRDAANQTNFGAMATVLMAEVVDKETFIGQYKFEEPAL